MKRAIIGFLTSVAITIATLCVLEGFASAVLFERDYRSAHAPKGIVRPHTTHDTLLGWVNKPSFASPNEYGAGVGLTTTALGFRATSASGVADSSASSANEGLVCSGDSYTLGYGVSDEHSWCALLARSADAQQNARRTYNMGQADYGLDQSALWYERDGHRVPHTIELLGITAGSLERMPTPSYEGRYKPTLRLRQGKAVTSNVPVPKQTANALRKASQERVKYNLRAVQAFMQLSGIDPRAKAARRVDAQWPLVERVLDDLAAANTANGSKLVLAYLPMRRELRSKSSDERRQRLASYAHARGITFIDLLPVMRSMRPDSIDNSFISHVPSGAAPGEMNQYTDLGHAWVARALAAALSRATLTSAVASRAH